MKTHKNIVWYGRYTFIGLSVIWAVMALYGFKTFGWVGRFADLSPAEFVIQISALFFPVSVFYLIGSYIDRNQLAQASLNASKTYLEELIYPSELGAKHVQELNQELKQQIQLFKGSFTEVTQHTKQVREDLTHWIEELNNIITHMGVQSQKMAEFVAELESASETANQQTAQATENMATQADILLKVSQETESHLQKTSKNLATQTEEISQNMHAVTQSEKQISTALDKSAVLVQGLSQNAQNIEKAMNKTNEMAHFLQETEKVLLKFKEIGTTLDMRLKTLKQKSLPATEKTEQETALPSAKEFTDKMQQILEKLQGLSVEMMSVFELKNEETLWNNYYAGDKAVFMRHIKNMLGQAKHQRIFDTALMNPDFQENVKTYMATFESLTKGLENSPWLGVLVGSDAGRLYMVLATLFKGEKNAG